MFGRNKDKETDDQAHSDDFHPSKSQVKRATRTRKGFALFTSLLLFVSVIFIVLVEIGDVRMIPVLNRIYFIKLDLSNIIPTRVPNAVLINSIAQTLGLHDFYTVGLWSFCEGYNGQGVTNCSKPELLYWFNPVEIIENEMLSNARIALPNKVYTILSLIRLASHWMFGLFLAGACLAFLMIFIVPLSVYSHLAAIPIAITTFLAALCTTVAAAIATVMFIIMQNAITSVTQLNIGASVGIEMFSFMWVAAATAILASLIQFGLCCCCASRRDVKKGKKKGSKKAWEDDEPGTREKHPGGFSSSP